MKRVILVVLALVVMCGVVHAGKRKKGANKPKPASHYFKNVDEELTRIRIKEQKGKLHVVSGNASFPAYLVYGDASKYGAVVAKVFYGKHREPVGVFSVFTNVRLKPVIKGKKITGKTKLHGYKAFRYFNKKSGASSIVLQWGVLSWYLSNRKYRYVHPLLDKVDRKKTYTLALRVSPLVITRLWKGADGKEYKTKRTMDCVEVFYNGKRVIRRVYPTMGRGKRGFEATRFGYWIEDIAQTTKYKTKRVTKDDR
jgi:hypothetical protein